MVSSRWCHTSPLYYAYDNNKWCHELIVRSIFTFWSFLRLGFVFGMFIISDITAILRLSAALSWLRSSYRINEEVCRQCCVYECNQNKIYCHCHYCMPANVTVFADMWNPLVKMYVWNRNISIFYVNGSTCSWLMIFKHVYDLLLKRNLFFKLLKLGTAMSTTLSGVSYFLQIGMALN